jgi:predicted nucleotidyltransferase
MAEARIAAFDRVGTLARDRVTKHVSDLLRALEADNVTITAAYVYGSYAEGTADRDSDIDVAVVAPDLSGDRLEDWVRLTTIGAHIDARFEVVGFRPEQFRDENPLVWEVKTSGIRVR